MKQRKLFIKTYSDAKIKRAKWINIGMIIFISATVLHDSFKHELPFYYILFLLAGLIIGRIVSIFQKVSNKKEEKLLTIESNRFAILVTVILMSIKYFTGKIILGQFNVVWISDAILLVFIGIYYSKLKNMFNQIDERVYTYLIERK